MKYTRPFFDLIFFLSPLIFPWWFSLFLAFGGLWYFKFFVEAILVGLVVDSLYGIRLEILKDFYFVYTTLMMLVFVVVESLKTILRKNV